VINEHEEPWWNDVSSGKLLIRPPELSLNPTSSHPVATQEELGEGNHEFGLMKYLLSYFEGTFNMPKILRHGASGISSPPKEGVLRICIAIKNPPPSAWIESANLGSNGHYTTVDEIQLR
jgi:hypothetical protein